jgi:hypothetical protein
MRGLVLSLLGGPIWVDTQVQRLVDSGMHALMRAGVSKALIRYTLFAGAILSGAAWQMCDLMAGQAPGGRWA